MLHFPSSLSPPPTTTVTTNPTVMQHNKLDKLMTRSVDIEMLNIIQIDFLMMSMKKHESLCEWRMKLPENVFCISTIYVNQECYLIDEQRVHIQEIK